MGFETNNIDQGQLLLLQKKLKALGEELSASDSRLGGSIVYCTCSTAGNVAAKVATIVSGRLDELNVGDMALVYFSGSNMASSPTLKVGSTAAKTIMRYEQVNPGTIVASSWNSGSPVLFVYDGTYWRIVGWLNTTYSTMPENEAISGTATTSRLIAAKVLKKAVQTHAPVTSVNGQTGAVTTAKLYYKSFTASTDPTGNIVLGSDFNDRLIVNVKVDTPLIVWALGTGNIDSTIKMLHFWDYTGATKANTSINFTVYWFEESEFQTQAVT